MIVSHEIARGIATVTLSRGGDELTDRELERAVARPFISEGGRWELAERLEDAEGNVTLRFERAEGGPPALEHQRWLRERGAGNPPRSRKTRRRETKAEQAARSAKIAALGAEWDEEQERLLAHYVAHIRQALYPL